ncbi:MAG: carbohydrate ABC transporter permease [Chloroflexi bacterium]|nr:carbohydrate ABC transporter permease [Chloroflexota bacterium]
MAATTMTPQTKIRDERRQQMIWLWVQRIMLYLVLTLVAFLMIFPFLYMFFTSLKTADDVFHSPPRLLPYSPETIERNGEQVPVYAVQIDGVTREMVVDDSVPAVTFGWFTTAEQINAQNPEASAGLIQVPLDETTELPDAVTIDGENFDQFQVTINGQTQTLVLAYRRGLRLFVDINDPTITTYAAPRNTPQVEFVDPQWENYNTVIALNNLGRALVNTALVTVLVTAGQVSTSLLGGYAFSRIRFRGRDTLFLVYLGTIMIPFVVLIIPLYQVMVILGWQDSLVSLIIPWLFTAYGTFLMRQFFVTIPKDLEEAALLDGASRFGILWRIFIPLSGPAIATQTIITFLYAWNSFLWPLIIINAGNLNDQVVTLALNHLRNVAASQPNLVLTGAAVAVIPPMIVFVLAQRYFIEGIASTGLKG